MTTNQNTQIAVLSTAPLEVESLKGKIEKFTILNDEDCKLLIETGVIVARLEKNLDDERKEKTEGYNQEVKRINGQYKPFLETLDALKTQAKKKINDYRAEVAKRQAEKQRKIDEELARQRQAELDAAKKKGIEPPQVALVVPTKKQENKMESDTGAATGKKTWQAEIVDYQAFFLGLADKKIPMEAVEPKMGFLKREAGAFKRDGVYPGVRFFEVEDISFNTK